MTHGLILRPLYQFRWALQKNSNNSVFKYFKKIVMALNDYSKYTVLVIDDVPLNLLLVEKMLGRYKFAVKSAGGGQQGLDMIAEQKPDVVLLDLMMPNIDGYEVLRRLRSNSETKYLPVIILSALNSDADIIKGFKVGANDFVTKPIIMDKLIKAILKQVAPEEVK